MPLCQSLIDSVQSAFRQALPGMSEALSTQLVLSLNRFPLSDPTESLSGIDVANVVENADAVVFRIFD